MISWEVAGINLKATYLSWRRLCSVLFSKVDLSVGTLICQIKSLVIQNVVCLACIYINLVR